MSDHLLKKESNIFKLYSLKIHIIVLVLNILQRGSRLCNIATQGSRYVARVSV